MISLPDQTAVCVERAEGAPIVLVALHWSATGSYLAPVLKRVAPSLPPQTIIVEPVDTAVWSERADGAPVIDTGIQAFPTGS
jgi:hypothetical protein